MDIEKSIIELSTQVQAIKTSQEIGSSSSTIYPIVKNYTLDWTTGQYEFTGCRFIFKSNTRIFPKLRIEVKKCTVNGNSITPNAIYYPKPGQWGYSSDIYEATATIEVGYNASSVSVSLVLDVYADTTGTYNATTGNIYG